MLGLCHQPTRVGHSNARKNKQTNVEMDVPSIPDPLKRVHARGSAVHCFGRPAVSVLPPPCRNSGQMPAAICAYSTDMRATSEFNLKGTTAMLSTATVETTSMD